MFVRTLSGRTAAIDVSGSDTVASLKAAIEQREGVPAQELRLTHGGRHLQGAHTLAACGLLTPGAAPPTLHLLLSLAGGKGGFGSNLRAAGKHKLVDNFDACRDLQGRRIRHKTAADKLAVWQSQAAERELEKVALKHLKELEKAEKREQVAEVDIGSVRNETKAALAGVQSAVAYALQKNGGASGSGAQTTTGAKPKRKIDALELSSDSDSDLSEDKEEEEEEAEAAAVKPARQSSQGGTAAVEAAPAVEEKKSQDMTSDDAAAATGASASVAAKARATVAEAAPAAPAVVAPVAPAPAAPVEPLNFERIDCVEDLEALGLERLKGELVGRGLKCGGTLRQRAERLFQLKTTPLAELDPKHFAAASK